MFGSSSTRAAALRFACMMIMVVAPVRGGAQSAVAARAPEARSRSGEVSSALLAKQVGVKLSPAQPEELSVGNSLSGTLADSTKLALFGLANACSGARVTMLRSAEQRLIVEVDEMEPVARTRRVTVRLREDGRLGVLAP